ncbi:hypothetical protein Mapa_004681 [Marchantia paleacea]|nr:hypothetical protein Mapa_004681 [Marchantia paleacea]
MATFRTTEGSVTPETKEQGKHSVSPGSTPPSILILILLVVAVEYERLDSERMTQSEARRRMRSNATSTTGPERTRLDSTAMERNGTERYAM